MMMNSQQITVNVLKWALLTACVALLSACGSQQHSDLDAYIVDVKEKTKGRIEPLPEIKQYPSVEYDAAELREPFTPYSDEPTETFIGDERTPDTVRTREALEAFPLDSLSFVGHLERDGSLWGLVQAPDDSIHRVSVGNHLGKNYGEILSISESNIVLKELIRDGAGSWIEREASLALTE